MRQVRGVVMPCSQNPYCQVGDPQTGGQWQQQRFFPRNKEYKLNTEFTNLEILHQEDECTLKNIWLWRPIGLIFWRSKELWEIETLLSKDTHEISRTQSRSSKMKWSLVRSTWCSWSISWRDRRQVELTLGTEMLVAAILGSSSQHVDTGAGKEILEFFP